MIVRNFWSGFATAVVISTGSWVILSILSPELKSIPTSFWEFVEEKYSLVPKFFGSDYSFHVFGATLYSAGLLWLYNIFFLFVDFTKPKWARQFKIQDNQPLDVSKFLNALPQILFNQIVLGFASGVAMYEIMKWRNPEFDKHFPSPLTIVRDIAVTIVLQEILFYYSHRLFHHPSIYKYIHKKHHEWTAPIGITAVYAHPIEHILSNVAPIVAGPIVCGSHPFTVWIWYAMALFSTTVSHSGYHFPLLPSPEFHDYHHYSFTQNFGTLGILDTFHGTNAQFVKSVANKRNFTSLSFVPVKVQFPDKKKE